MKLLALCVFLSVLAGSVVAQDSWTAPGNANPLLPGYFADPTIRKFGDTWYLYATTDGTRFVGLPAVWTSKDFVNWTCHRFPRFYASEFFWAPDVARLDDGRFFLAHSHPCMVYGYTGGSPFGPWTSVTPGKPLVPDRLVKDVITLDGQTFRDDDGSWYMTWCTWAIYPNNGCGVGTFNPDMASFSGLYKIPNTQADKIFEGPFLFKRKGLYYLTYSCEFCENESYHLRYATSDKVLGTYTPGRTNPILQKSADLTVQGPGHHSLYHEGDDDYIVVYHRHDIPRTNNGGHRQVCADRMYFEADNAIRPIVPTHKGLAAQAPNVNPFPNLALCKPVTASSQASPGYKAEFAVDDNHATLWRPASAVEPAWLSVDLGSVQRIRRIHTQFEYPTFYYQYALEVSTDGQAWTLFSDKRNNRLYGSPMTDFGDIKARYVRLTVTGTEMLGWLGAVWNLRVFGDSSEDPPQEVVHLEADDLAEGALDRWENSLGMLGGSFTPAGAQPAVSQVEGRKAVVFDGTASLLAPAPLPSGLTGKQGAFTLAAWVCNKGQADGVVVEGGRRLPAALAPADGRWHHVALTGDAGKQTLFIDGVASDKKIASTAGKAAWSLGKGLSGAIASVRVFNRCLWPSEIAGLAQEKYVAPAKAWAGKRQGLAVALDAAGLPAGSLVDSWPNTGGAGGAFTLANGRGAPRVDVVAGVKAVLFDGASSLGSDAETPVTFTGNSPFTAAAWVFNPALAESETVFLWSRFGGPDTGSAALRYGSGNGGAVLHWGWADMGWKGGAPKAGEWHHLAAVFDGSTERLYVDGKLNDTEVKTLFANTGSRMFVGGADREADPFSGAVASVCLYDVPLPEAEIVKLAATRPSSGIVTHIDSKGMAYGAVKELPNQGSAGGAFTCTSGEVRVADADGRIALVFDGTQSLVAGAAAVPAAGTLIVIANGSGAEVAALGGVSLAPAGKGWHHLALAWEASGATRYLDGVPAGKVDVPSGNGALTLGRTFTGAVTLCQVQDKALSPDELKAACAVWQAQCKAPAPNPAAFASPPHVVTPSMVTLEAARPESKACVAQWFFAETTGGATSNWLDVPTWRQDGLKPDSSYAYTVKMRDALGNVTAPSAPATVRTERARFDLFTEDFANAQDLKAAGTAGSKWDGIVGAEKAVAARIANGRLHLESTKSFWIDEEPRGLLVYRNVTGDFVAEVEVPDLMGLDRKEAIGNQAGGLMARVADIKAAGEREDLITHAVFPAWGCGNIVSSLDSGGRPEWSPRNGWGFGRFLQMERRGDAFYLRYSRDGIAWTDMPGSPVQRADMHGLPLQVGLFHSTHGGEQGWVEYAAFRLWSLAEKQQ